MNDADVSQALDMILSFKDTLTESIDNGTVRKGFPSDLVRRAQQLLYVLDIAKDLNNLRSPPGNRLEKLGGNRLGSIRSVSTNNGGFASSGRIRVRKTR